MPISWAWFLCACVAERVEFVRTARELLRPISLQQSRDHLLHSFSSSLSFRVPRGDCAEVKSRATWFASTRSGAAFSLVNVAVGEMGRSKWLDGQNQGMLRCEAPSD